MPHAEVARAIATSLHALPHPRHGEIRLMGFRPTALAERGVMLSHSQEVHDKVNAHAQAVGEAIVEVVERAGKTIVDTAELESLRRIAAIQAESGTKIAKGFCAHCGCEVINLAVDGEMNAKLHRIALESVYSAPHRCWEK